MFYKIKLSLVFETIRCSIFKCLMHLSMLCWQGGGRWGKGKGFDVKFCPVRREFDNYGGPGGKSFETSLYIRLI